MSIEEMNKLDFIAAKPGSPVVKLYITDHLSWDDLHRHSRLLQEKINAYLAFIESDQLRKVTTPPIPTSPELCIVLACMYEPPHEACAFLDQVRATLQQYGLRFEYEHRPRQATS